MPFVIQRVVPVFLVLTLGQHQRMFALLLTPARSGMALMLTVGLLFALLLLSIVGLWRRAPWGFAAFYLLVPVATALHGIALVPFVVMVLPEPMRIPAVFVLNVAVLVLGILAQRRSGLGSRRLATAA